MSMKLDDNHLYLRGFRDAIHGRAFEPPYVNGASRNLYNRALYLAGFNAGRDEPLDKLMTAQERYILTAYMGGRHAH